MVTDQQLYALIKKAVHERKAIPHHETQNFAERYCSQQLAKKKLKTHHNHQKMDCIMKNFSKLDTYFDLPELLNSINILKLKDENERMISTCKPEEKRPRGTTKLKLNRHFTDFKNLRYVCENEDLQRMLTDLESDNEWKSENLKNNSNYNLSSLYQRSRDEKENEVLKQQTAKIFDLLQKYKDNQHQFLHREKEESIKQTQLNSQKKKLYTSFLHKVSSYLQIILETDHKSKWKRHTKNRSSFMKKNMHTFASIYDQKIKTNLKSPKKPTINPNLSNTRCIEVLRQETRKIRESEQNSKDSHLPQMKAKFNFPSSRFYAQNFDKSHEKQHSSAFYMSNSPDPEEKRPSQIKSNFTFKRRNIKQKIINKLGKFIGEIDDEEHCSKKENSYYNKEINKLEVQFKHLYGRYKRQTLAGEKDIEDLKMLAQQFQVRPSAGKAEDDDFSQSDLIGSQTQTMKMPIST